MGGIHHNCIVHQTYLYITQDEQVFSIGQFYRDMSAIVQRPRIDPSINIILHLYVCMYVNLATDFYIYKVEAYVLRCRHLTQNCFGNSVPSWMLNAAVLVLLIPLFYSKYRNENRTFWRGPRSMTKDFVRFFLQSCCIVPLDVLTKAYIGGVKCNSNHQT